MKRWLRKLLNEIMYPGVNAIGADSPNVVAKDPSSGFDSDHRGLNFTIYSADGGTIVSIREYDIANDRRTQKLHIIPDGKNFGEELAKIVTLESLRTR